MIYGNATISPSTLKTVILQDENGNEVATGVVVKSETVFTATTNDVREGKVFASDSGIAIGTKNIPNYHTTYGCKVVSAGKTIVIDVPEYDCKNLFVVVTTYDTSLSNSLLSTYIAIDGGMYAVNNTAKVSDITIDAENKQINLGITATEKSVVRYLVTKEEF